MTTFTIDSGNNIAAHTTPPASAADLESFVDDKELAKLAFSWPANKGGLKIDSSKNSGGERLYRILK